MVFFKKALQFPKLIYEFLKINRNNIVWVVKPYSLCKKIRAAESGEQTNEKEARTASFVTLLYISTGENGFHQLEDYISMRLNVTSSFSRMRCSRVWQVNSRIWP